MSNIIEPHNFGNKITFTANTDLTCEEFLGRAVTFAGGLSDAGRTTAGILMSTAESGGSIGVGVHGVLPYRPINVNCPGQALTVVADGLFSPAVNCSHEVGVCYGTQGTAAGGNVNSGAMGVGGFQFFTKSWQDSGDVGNVTI